MGSIVVEVGPRLGARGGDELCSLTLLTVLALLPGPYQHELVACYC